MNKLTGVEVIGAGYNPFRDFASTNAITLQIFNWQEWKEVSFKQGFYIPDVVDVQQQDSATYRNVAGSTISDYQNNLAVSVGLEGRYHFFSGSLTADFNTESLANTENEFTRIQQTISLWSLRLPVGDQLLRKYLRDDFRNALDNLPNLYDSDPTKYEDFFKYWGSHFLTGVVMGGRAVFSSATNKTQFTNKLSITTTAQATYDSLTGQLEAKFQAQYAESIKEFSKSSESKHTVVGGNGVNGAEAFKGPDQFKIWLKSVEEQPDFIDFIPQNAFAGIWELCSTTEQARSLEKYFTDVWSVNQSNKTRYYIDKLIVVNAANEKDIKVPDGYTKINTDLNRKAGGDYIYLCYHKTLFHEVKDDNGKVLNKNQNCIDAIKIMNTTDHQKVDPGIGYTLINTDLNKHTSDNTNIYLAYHSAPYDREKAIKDIVVIGGEEVEPYGYIKIDNNLNAGTERGDPLYICTLV